MNFYGVLYVSKKEVKLKHLKSSVVKHLKKLRSWYKLVHYKVEIIRFLFIWSGSS